MRDQKQCERKAKTGDFLNYINVSRNRLTILLVRSTLLKYECLFYEEEDCIINHTLCIPLEQQWPQRSSFCLWAWRWVPRTPPQAHTWTQYPPQKRHSPGRPLQRMFLSHIVQRPHRRPHQNTVLKSMIENLNLMWENMFSSSPGHWPLSTLHLQRHHIATCWTPSWSLCLCRRRACRFQNATTPTDFAASTVNSHLVASPQAA